MQSLASYIIKQPIVPYVRECDFAIRKPWSFPERRLLDYLLVYVQEGTCCFWVDGRENRIEKGEFCFIQPNSLVYLEGKTNTVTPFLHLDFFYHEDRELSFPTKAGQVDISSYSHLLQPRLDTLIDAEIPVILNPVITSKIRDSFLKVVEYWSDYHNIAQLKAQVALTEILLTIIESFVSQKPAKRPSVQSLNWITSYFSYYLSEPLRVEDMARRANLSISRFNDLFKQQYGMTPHLYLLDMRLKHATELLLTTKLSQEQIAYYCGFADIHHFSKTFKKKIGLAPGRYRKAHVRD